MAAGSDESRVELIGWGWEESFLSQNIDTDICDERVRLTVRAVLGLGLGLSLGLGLGLGLELLLRVVRFKGWG
jgi:hypothetical protein